MLPSDFPELAIVRVLTAGGPYVVGDALSVAFVTPTIGRLVAHDATDIAAAHGGSGTVPDTISVRVTHAAPPYERDAILALSFVDPRVARIHPTGERARENRVLGAIPEIGATSGTTPVVAAARQSQSQHEREFAAPTAEGVSERTGERIPRHDRDLVASALPIARDDPRASCDTAPVRVEGVRVRLDWSPDRVRRFVQVVDKLFTVDRLGWYRHAFAMRLLIPDEISCGDAVSDIEAMRHLVALRAAAVETLGRPMLAAFMPNFAVTSDWLDSLDSPAAARALAGLRDAITPYVVDDTVPQRPSAVSVSTGIVERRDLVRQPASTVDSILPLLIASHATDTSLSERLGEYRRTLVEVFGQTAQAAEAVRLNQMAQPNHALDDRLWQLVGTVGESLGGLAVA